jgi:hypothetical protein
MDSKKVALGIVINDQNEVLIIHNLDPEQGEEKSREMRLPKKQLRERF